jgi:hypothetical protein
MALLKTSVTADVGTLYVVQADATNSEDNVDGSSGVLYKVEIDNSGNSVACYLKVYDTTGDVTVGTTNPEWVFKCPAEQVRVYSCPKGTAYANGLKVACTTTPGTAGTTNPTNDVTYRILLGT